MSNVVILNKSILSAKAVNVELCKVYLPFYVDIEKISRLRNLLSKIKVEFLVNTDKLEISNLIYNNIIIKNPNLELKDSRITIKNTYVVTMKDSILSKSVAFYNKLTSNIKQVPEFNIINEENLQKALEEVTTEINLSEISANLNSSKQENEEPSQVLANDPLENKIITPPVEPINVDNQIRINNQIQDSNVESPNEVAVNSQDDGSEIPLKQPENVSDTLKEITKENTNLESNVNNYNDINNKQPINPQDLNKAVFTGVQTQIQNNLQEQIQNNINNQIQNQNMINTSDTPKAENLTNQEVNNQQGSVFTVPIIIIWLGLVLVGTVKLVTTLLS